jgi:Uma2 family endonuclease
MEASSHPVILTYDDYRRLPEDGRRYELLEGNLHVTPAPLTIHQRVSRNLEFVLHEHVRNRDLGEVLDAPVDVILGRTTVLQPDLLFVERGRLGMISERGIEGPPQLVVEILSPSTEETDRGPKQHLYARYGVRYYWIADPVARTLTEMRRERNAYTVVATHCVPERVTTELFPDLVVDLGEIFPAPR